MALLFFVPQAARLFAAQGAGPEDTFFQVCAKGTAEEVRKVLKDGAKINAKDEEDMTALMYAARDNADPEVMKVLLRAVAKFNKEVSWYEPGKKVNVNAGNEKGKTDLMLAAANN